MSTPVHQLVISDQDFDVGSEYAELCASAPRSGAAVFFVGLVRDLYQDQLDNGRVDYLELEHYPGMTESLCQEILDEAEVRFSFDAVRLIHRVGKLYAGEQIVMVAVASRHRNSAFQAAQFIMDYLKVRATFWKKEVGPNGERWLGVKNKDQIASGKWSS